MLNLARAAAEERAAYVNETAARRNVPVWMVEKDFGSAGSWASCSRWMRSKATSCSRRHLALKVFGVIHRFSEDIDLSISRPFSELMSTA